MSYVNIAALQIENVPVDDDASIFSCVGEWEYIDMPHFACSGSLRNCVGDSVSHQTCQYIFWVGSPDIVIFE